MGNGGKKVEKAAGAVTVPGTASAPTPLPAPCRNEAIVWKNVRSEVANILTQSDSMSKAWKPGKVKISDTPLPPVTDDLGLTGRTPTDPKNRDLVGLQFAWSKIKSRFELASILSHEYMHANQVLSRKFTHSEAAPFLSVNQYITLKWASEFEAFSFQVLVLKEIVKTMPVFAPCEKAILAKDDRLRLIAEGKANDARKEITNSYSVWKLSDQHKKESGVSAEERKALQDVKNNVDSLLKSGDWKKEEGTWKSYFPA